MPGNIAGLIAVFAVMAGVLALIPVLGYIYSLNSIKSRTVGDGQHGTARFASRAEEKKAFKEVLYSPGLWREGKALPVVQGIIVGCKERGGKTFALVEDGDLHAMMMAATGTGKTTFFLYPNLEYACASGMSFLATDTKGDLVRWYGKIAGQYYGYRVAHIDLRNPARSHGSNMIHLVNKYMDKAIAAGDIAAQAKAERFAKITAKTIISDGTDNAAYGQNAFFYDAAEGLVTAAVLLVSEFAEEGERHIISVFKLIQELLAPSGVKGKNRFQLLMDLLPDDHKAKWFAGAALNTAEQAMLSVMSTALSRLNAFLDSELEQVLCFDTEVDAEVFCKEKCALFITMPEEDPSKFFLVSLVIQQLAREILSVADELGGRLNNRVMFYCEEMGTLPAISSAEMLFSAARSRMLSIVAIVQSHMQMVKNYGQEGANIIMDNCGLFIAGGFAPSSDSADLVSKALGSRTVMSGSVSRGIRDPSQSLQMMERPLMTADELRTMPKGRFIVMKIGQHPILAKLKLYFKWGIAFDGPPFELPDKSARRVAYVSKARIEAAIMKKYPQKAGSAPEEGPAADKKDRGVTSDMREKPQHRLRT